MDEMNHMYKMMSDMELNVPGDIEILHTTEWGAKYNFPEQYIEFMRLYNGGEGPIGEYGYLAIWDIEEMMWFNQSSDVDKIPGLIYFASDRGGTLWAFDTKSSATKIVELYVDTIHYTDVEIIADTFEEFIEYVYNIDDSKY